MRKIKWPTLFYSRIMYTSTISLNILTILATLHIVLEHMIFFVNNNYGITKTNDDLATRKAMEM